MATKRTKNISSLSDKESQLKLFDLDTTYGPCIGITRLQRLDRAIRLGLPNKKHLLVMKEWLEGENSEYSEDEHRLQEISCIDVDCLEYGKV